MKENNNEEIKVGDIVKFKESCFVDSGSIFGGNLYGSLGLVAKIDFACGECFYSCIYNKDGYAVSVTENKLKKINESQVEKMHLTNYFGEDLIKKYRGDRDDEPTPYKPSVLSYQVGGTHYKDKAIQPVEYICANKLDFLEGCIVKRITRHREKLGAFDICKIRQECDLILQLEYGTTFEEVIDKQQDNFFRKEWLAAVERKKCGVHPREKSEE